MEFSVGSSLTKTQGLSSISYGDLKVLAREPAKIAVTAAQYADMSSIQRGDIKKGQKYFITSTAKSRGDKAVKAAGLTGIVLDLDNSDSSIESVVEKLTDTKVSHFLVYSTITHTKDKPRYRAVIPFALAADEERWKIVASYLNDVLFVDSDACGKTMAQAWLLPVVTADGDFESHIVEVGDALDINDDDHPLVLNALSFSSLVSKSESSTFASSREFNLNEGEISPVIAYNQEFSLRERMQQFGFVFTSKNRAKHPNSLSGTAGVYMFACGERAFSHHGSDPLCGNSFDAFDLCVQLEHQGDFKSALKAVGESIYTSEGITVTEHNRKLFSQRKAYSSVKDFDISTVLGAVEKANPSPKEDKTATFDITPPPEHCFAFSGIGKDIFDNIIQSAIYPQPTFALAATLMTMSMLTAGRLTGTQTRVRSNLMFICTGESGCGKQHNINKVENITALASADLNKKVQNKFASGPAFWNFLTNNGGEVLLLADECGFLFNSIKNNKGDYLAQLYDCFLQGYSASSTVLKPTVYSDKERNSQVSIEHPHICLMGFTTGSTLADALTHEDSSTGLLPRLLFFPAVFDVPDKQKYNPVSFDVHAIEGFQMVYDFTNWKGLLPYSRKLPLHVPTTSEAEALLDEFGNQNRLAMRNSESMERNLLNRAEENARRLALVYWTDCVCPTDGQGGFTTENMIQAEHAQKAIDLVKWSLAYTWEFMTDQAGATITSKEVDRLVSIISQAKEYGGKRKGQLFDRHRDALNKGLMPRAVLVKLSKKSAKNLDELLETAGSMEAIGKTTEPDTGRVYYFTLP
ncbi:DUF3987 domain-containing protein [Enterovibrio calviensis]|uniref:DUF3987 domain-containing protein n=1 Tax=Enterovibrio calviensis TaxID=91359 RepID=UPI00373556A7